MTKHRSHQGLRRAMRSGLSVLSLAAALPFAPAVAHAGEAGDAAAAPAAAGTGDIVVTATRRSELAKDVPVAVTAIGGEKLDNLNSSGLDIRFLSGRTPSLQIESSFGRTFPRFYIRGLGNTDYDPNAAQPVSVVYDDVALESPMLKSFPVFDLKQVEVLRGPQGSLFGRNTPAGVVKLESAKPTDYYTGYVSGEWGTYNTLNVEGAMSGPLGGGFTARISGLLERRDNWVHNTNAGAAGSVAKSDLEGYRDVAGRLQIAYASPDKSFNALWDFHARDLAGTPRIFRAGMFQQGTNNFAAGFDPSKVSLDGYTSQQLTQWGTSLHLDYHIDGVGTIYSISSYEKAKVESSGDIDGGATYTGSGLGVGAYQDSTGGYTRPEEISQEIRFASDEFHGMRLQGGFYYFHQNLQYSEYEYDGNSGYTNRANDLDQDVEHYDVNENYGVFASGEAKLGKLTLRAGVRYSEDHKNDLVWGWMPSYSIYSAYDSGNTITEPSGTYSVMTPQRMRVSGSDVTWDASATYAATRAINAYARVATGYQGPAIQDRVTFGSYQSSAPKQTTISVEGGFKGSALDHKLTFSIDAYYNETKNMQVTAVGGLTASAQLYSLKKVLGHGVEAEFELRPIEGLSISASGSYNFTKIKDPNAYVSPCGGGCTVTNAIVDGLASINNNPLPQAPKWVGNITIGYERPVAPNIKAFVMTDWSYRSSVNFFLYEAKEFVGKPLTEGGVKIGVKTDDGWELAFYGRNILNQIRAVGALDFNNLTGMINDPRILGVAVRKAW